MDINDIRTIITVVSFVIFVGILTWAWSSRRKKDFQEAAEVPFSDDDLPPRDGSRS